MEGAGSFCAYKLCSVSITMTLCHCFLFLTKPGCIFGTGFGRGWWGWWGWICREWGRLGLWNPKRVKYVKRPNMLWNTFEFFTKLFLKMLFEGCIFHVWGVRCLANEMHFPCLGRKVFGQWDAFAGKLNGDNYLKFWSMLHIQIWFALKHSRIFSIWASKVKSLYHFALFVRTSILTFTHQN